MKKFGIIKLIIFSIIGGGFKVFCYSKYDILQGNPNKDIEETEFAPLYPTGFEEDSMLVQKEVIRNPIRNNFSKEKENLIKEEKKHLKIKKKKKYSKKNKRIFIQYLIVASLLSIFVLVCSYICILYAFKKPPNKKIDLTEVRLNSGREEDLSKENNSYKAFKQVTKNKSSILSRDSKESEKSASSPFQSCDKERKEVECKDAVSDSEEFFDALDNLDDT